MENTPVFRDDYTPEPEIKSNFLKKIAQSFYKTAKKLWGCPSSRSVILVATAIFSTLFCIYYASVFTQRVLYIQGFPLISQETATGYSYTGEYQGDTVTILVEDGEFATKTIVFSNTNGNTNQYSYETGQSENAVFPEIYSDSSYGYFLFQNDFTLTEAQIAKLASNSTSIRGNFTCILGFFLVLTTWLLSIKYPLLGFYLKTFPDLGKGEPSDWYYFSQNLNIFLLSPVVMVILLLIGVYLPIN